MAFPINLTFHSTADASLTIDDTGTIVCMIEGKRTDGSNHKDGCEHAVATYADHVGMDYSEVLTLVEAQF